MSSVGMYAAYMMTVFPMKVGTVEAPALIQVQDGRPDIHSILQTAAYVNPDQAAVGVFVAGPETMANAVKVAVADLNDAWQKPYLDLSSYAFEL